MANQQTPNYNFTLPEVGAAADDWGNLLNENWSSLDTTLDGLESSIIAQIEAITIDSGAGLTGSGDTESGFTLAVDLATSADFFAGTSEKVLDANVVSEASDLVSLSGSGSVAPDLDAGRNFEMTLTGSAELANPDNQAPGRYGLIVVRQDGTGGHPLAYGSHWRFPSGPIDLADGANAINVISYFVLEQGTVLGIQVRDLRQ